MDLTFEVCLSLNKRKDLSCYGLRVGRELLFVHLTYSLPPPSQTVLGRLWVGIRGKDLVLQRLRTVVVG